MNKVLDYKWFGMLLACWLISGPGWGQSELRKAQAHFQSYEFARAITEYQKVLQSRPANLALAQNLAHAYRLTGNSREAEAWFAKVLTFPAAAPVNIYHYAEALRSNGKYAQARAQYQAYAAKVPADAARAEKRVQAIDLALAWLTQPAAVDLQPVARLNSPYADFSPVFFDNGLLFVSDRPSPATGAETVGWTGRPALQLFYAAKDKDNAWGPPAPLEGAINAATHTGPAAAQGSNILYFTRTFIRKEKQKSANTDPTSWTAANGKSKELVNRLAIYSVEKRRGKWGNLRAFAYNKTDQYSVGHPALSPDGRYLYFVSDMPGGKGQTDIYYCERRGNSWSRPVNAGPQINTSGRESFPVIAADGTLYFSSDGHPGMGGLDLFSARGAKAAWQEVLNLKPPFNSPQDDFGILWEPDKLSGYLSSNRESADGTDNLYAFRPADKQVKEPVAVAKPDPAKDAAAVAPPATTPPAEPLPAAAPGPAPAAGAMADKPRATADPAAPKPAAEPAPVPVSKPAPAALPRGETKPAAPATKTAAAARPPAAAKPAAAPQPVTATPVLPAGAARELVLRIETRAGHGNQQEQPLPGVTLKIARKGVKGDSVRAGSGAQGRYWFRAGREATYTIAAVKPGYLKQVATVSTAGFAGDTMRVELLLAPLKKNVPVVLKNIYYDLDKADIRPDAAEELNKLVQLLQENPGIRIEIAAHTDSRQSHHYNLDLSRRRAQAVVNYLVSKGISAGRLSAKGYGKSRLLNHCREQQPCSEAEHQLNRRTEFRIR